MACGGVFLGLDSPMYRDLGMVPGIHYLTHDGTVEGLVAVIRTYQHPGMRDQLEQISARGVDFVNNTLRPNVVYQRFITRLTKTIRAKTG